MLLKSLMSYLISRDFTRCDQTENKLSQIFFTDVLYPLPDGWPKIPELFVRRSWDFSTATCPSINKATAHLELLQNIIEDWSLQTRNDALCRTSSRATDRTKSRLTTASSVAGSTTTERKQIRFIPSAISSVGTNVRQPFSRGEDIVSGVGRSTTAELSIQGIGANIDSCKCPFYWQLI